VLKQQWLRVTGYVVYHRHWMTMTVLYLYWHFSGLKQEDKQPVYAFVGVLHPSTFFLVSKTFVASLLPVSWWIKKE